MALLSSASTPLPAKKSDGSSKACTDTAVMPPAFSAQNRVEPQVPQKPRRTFSEEVVNASHQPLQLSAPPYTDRVNFICGQTLDTQTVTKHGRSPS